MAKIVAYDTLIPEIAGIQPNIAWLLANVNGSDRITEVLEDLQLKYARLQGKILELESGVVELEVGTVTVTLPEEETGDDLAYVEEALRSTLAETIVQRGEEQLERERLEKNQRYAQLYGGDFTKLIQGPSCHVVHDVVFLDFEFTPEAARRWREQYLGTQESIETWTPQPPNTDACPVLPGDAQVAAHTLGYWAVQDAIEEARINHEEAEAFGAALAAVGAYGEEIPDIDMDGQPLN